MEGIEGSPDVHQFRLLPFKRRPKKPCSKKLLAMTIYPDTNDGLGFHSQQAFVMKSHVIVLLASRNINLVSHNNVTPVREGSILPTGWSSSRTVGEY